MNRIPYDDVKDRLSLLLRRIPFLRRFFYFLLDLFFLRSWYIRRVIRNLARRTASSESWKILDAGCGFGQYDRFVLTHLRRSTVTAVDVKRDYLEDCSAYFSQSIKTGRLELRETDLLTIDLDERYDLILCIDVLEHIEDDLEVIRRLRRLLKPGGYLLMHSPSHLSSEDALTGEDSLVEEHARPGYSKEEITAKFSQAGLIVDEAAYTYGRPGHFAWRLSIKYPMLLYNRIRGWAVPPLAIYLPVVLPVSLLLNRLDMCFRLDQGHGVWALGRCPEESDSERENLRSA